MHDFDNNTKLDGLEILKALTHLLPYEEDEQEEKANMRGKSADEKAKEKREKELLYYTGNLVFSQILQYYICAIVII